ncbi:hypothetical protein [Marinovum sp.]|uniref:hypothetical protein n=1 Tax=Marinovum sp. TaxID=2024839 RepID=UPI003A8F323F
MDPTQIRIALFVGGVIAVCGLTGFVLVRRAALTWFYVLAAAVFALGVVFMTMAQRAQGWDALGHFLIVVFLIAPALAGLGLGGALAWWRKRRRR